MSLSLYIVLILRCMQIVAVKISATDSHSHVNMIIYDTFAIYDTPSCQPTKHLFHPRLLPQLLGYSWTQGNRDEILSHILTNAVRDVTTISSKSLKRYGWSTSATPPHASPRPSLFEPPPPQHATSSISRKIFFSVSPRSRVAKNRIAAGLTPRTKTTNLGGQTGRRQMQQWRNGWYP